MKLSHLIVGSLASAVIMAQPAALYAVEHELGNLTVSSQANIAPEDTFKIIDARGTINWSFWSASLIDINVPGKITEAAANSGLHFSTGTGGPGGVRFVLTGDNSYSGGTLIGTQSGAGRVIVHAGSSNALGTGTATIEIQGGGGGSNVKQGNALELSGDITISNKNLLLQGSGFDNKGSLNSVSGSNIWAGTISTRSYTDQALKPTIGVESGSLEIRGEISGSTATGLTKVGGGTLILSHQNSFQNGLVISEGVVLVSHAKALATGPVEVGTLGRLEIAGGTIVEVSDLDLKSNARLAFNLTGTPSATLLQVSGDQTGGGIFTVDITHAEPLAIGQYELMTIGGSHQATGFEIGNLPLGYTGELNWTNGVLSLNVTAIPEPGTAMLLLGIGAVGLAYRVRAGAARR